MLKIIWNKDEFDKIKEELEQNHQIKITKDPNEVPDNKIGIIIDDDQNEELKSILETYFSQKSKLILETQNGYIQIQANEVLFIESFGEDIYMHFEKMDTQMIKKPLYQLELLFKPFHFVRIGKSYIVNISKIRYIKTTLNAKLDLELIDGTHLEVSRSYVKEFRNAIGI
jgi:DNA-binding LytR/AlgR family response regulator